MKLTKITKYVLAASFFAGIVSCQNPLKDFNLQISSEIIKHTATVRIVDTEGRVIPGATVALNSGETQNIYNASGTRDFKVVDGLVTFGLDPNIPLEGNDVVRFRIEVQATGYTTQIAPVTISSASTGIEVVTLAKPTQPQDGLQEIQATLGLGTDGSTLTAASITLPSANPGEPAMTLNIPAGTQFKDANGNIIVGGSLSITVASFDTDEDDIKSLLPGGDLTADKVVLAGGREAPGTFSPAGITKINMVINGVAIKQFTNPISIGIPLPSDYKSPVTGRAIQAGNSFDLFSNSASDNTWRFEKAVVVTGTQATGFNATFEMSHLTFFLVGEFGESCSTGATVNFSGDWMNNGSIYPLKVEAEWGGDVIVKKEFSISLSSLSILLEGLPSGTKLYFKNVAGNPLAETVLAACGQVTNVQLPNPNEATSVVSTLQLYVRCPNKAEIITILPNFKIFYKVSGSTAEYAFLGEVNNGLLRTSLLKTDGTKYNFKAYYKDKVKVVLNKTVIRDNTATLGIQPGDILGEKVGATNLAILTEECNKL